MIDKKLKMEQLSKEVILTKAKSSLFLTLFSFLEFLNDVSTEDSLQNSPKELIEMRKKILNQCVGLKITLSDKDFKASSLENILELKNDLINLYMIVYSFILKLQILTTIAQDELLIRNLRAQEIEETNMNFDNLIADCIEFLEDTNENGDLKNSTSEILSVIPIKMARNKYFQLVEHHLKNGFVGTDCDEISGILQLVKFLSLFNNSDLDYNKFPTLAQAIDNLSQIVPSKLSDEDLDTYYSDLEMIFEDVELMQDQFSIILDDINSLIIIFSLDNTLEDLLNDDFTHKDIYNKFCEIAENSDNLFNDILADKISEIAELYIDKTEALETEQRKISNTLKEDQFSETLMNLLENQYYVSALFYEEAPQLLMHSLETVNIDSSIATEEFINEEVSKFIESIKAIFSNEAPHIRKALMRLLLVSLPETLTYDETMEYLETTLNISGFEGKLLIAEKLGQLFEGKGYFVNKKEATYEDSEDFEDFENFEDFEGLENFKNNLK